jgi:hypothetical protein
MPPTVRDGRGDEARARRPLRRRRQARHHRRHARPPHAQGRSGVPGDRDLGPPVKPFADRALAVAHSTVTNKVYLYVLPSTLDGWYNAAGALQATLIPQPVGVLWTAVATAPDVTIAELLGVAYIAHTEAATAAALSFATKTFALPGTIGDSVVRPR